MKVEKGSFESRPELEKTAEARREIEKSNLNFADFIQRRCSQIVKLKPRKKPLA